MKEIICCTIAEQLKQWGVDPEKVVPTASLVDDLGADSLDIAEIALELEEIFDIDLPDNGEGWVTVQDVVAAVANATAKAGA